jgi:hypothetical protein
MLSSRTRLLCMFITVTGTIPCTPANCMSSFHGIHTAAAGSSVSLGFSGVATCNAVTLEPLLLLLLLLLLQALVSVQESIGLSGVTTFNEFAVPLVARLAERLGLPGEGGSWFSVAHCGHSQQLVHRLEPSTVAPPTHTCVHRGAGGICVLGMAKRVPAQVTGNPITCLTLSCAFCDVSTPRWNPKLACDRPHVGDGGVGWSP